MEDSGIRVAGAGDGKNMVSKLNDKENCSQCSGQWKKTGMDIIRGLTILYASL